MTIAAVILAAEEGEGFTQSKYLARVAGEPIVASVLDGARSWPVDDVVLVLGPDAEDILAVIDLEGITALIDPEWGEGMASPMRVALDLVSRDRALSHVVLARGDQPGVTAADVERLVTTAKESGAAAVVPKYRYASGWPIVLSRGLFDSLLGHEGPLDVHDFVATHARDVTEVWFDHLEPTAYRTAGDVSSR